MNIVTDIALLPDTDAIARDLEHMTARWHELDAPAVIEIRAFQEGGLPKIGKFNPDDLDEAAEWIEGLNERGYNIYAVRNPVRVTVVGSAKDEDILASFFLWADCDEGQAADNVKQWTGPQYSACVVTGRVPSTRVHTYWELAEPATDLMAWRETQMSIAAHFNSDPSVINPSRIMRVGGTVAYPDAKKQGKGYIKELTALWAEYDPNRKPVTIDQMRRAFNTTTPATAPRATAPMIDTGAYEALDRERTAIQALSGEAWNLAVLKLVGSYVRKGLLDGEIHALTDPLTLGGYTVEQTRAEVQDIITRTRANPKFEGAGVEVDMPPSPQAVEKDSAGVITGLKIQSSAEFLSDLTPAVYVVDGVLAERRCLSLTGYAGHGKTTLALHLAIQVATGGTFGGMECEQGACLILAGENPDNVKWQYASAIAAAGTGTDLPVHFLPGHFQLSAYLDDLIAKANSIPNLRLVVIDSLQAFFEGENDNGNVEMMDAARRFRKLSEIPNGPTVVVIAHPAGKRPDKSNIVPRGGSSFGNEFDGNLTVWSEPDGTQVFHHTEKFRGAPFEPLTFVMEEREFDHLTDHKQRPLRLKVSRQQMLIEAASAAQKSESRDREAINAIENNPQITQRSLAEALRVSKSTADRVMQNLKDEKLIRRHAKKWVLTDGGKEFFNGE